ncbi:MAG: S41 family peptidase [Gammaproteobacteria bacterium]|nr:S41 family peptidase [Gammaproteobacteria bacterium]
MPLSFSRTIVLCFTLAAILAPPFAAGNIPSDLPDPWDDTKIGFSFVDQRVNNEACRQSESRYLSCISALDAVLAQAPRRLHLTHAAWQPGTRSTARPVARFGTLVIAEDTARDARQVRNALDNIKARRQRILDWQGEYRRGRGNGSDFDGALAWILLHVVEPDRARQYAAAAINGYISVDDAHARIFPAPIFSRAARGGSGNSETGGNMRGDGRHYTGVGVAVQRVADAIVVTGVVPDGPASRAGIRVGDVILSVGGKPVGEQPLAQVVTRLRGPADSAVGLAVQSQGALRKVTVRRDAVEIKNVVSKVIEEAGYHWGYLSLRSFTAPTTCSEARRELNALLQSDVDGLLLDLRDNMGGLIDQAVCIADLFLGPNLPVVQMRSLVNERRTRSFQTRYPPLTRMPMVGLANAGTGSASEVLLGALRDHGRSLVVGERTFGKGTMQMIRPWRGASNVMQFYTAAVMYSPSGRSVQMLGIEPDVVAYERPEGRPAGTVVLREEDLFPMALPAVSGSSPSLAANPRAAVVRRCVSFTGNADRRWKGTGATLEIRDYALYVGQDALRCLSRHGTSVLTARRASGGLGAGVPSHRAAPQGY